MNKNVINKAFEGLFWVLSEKTTEVLTDKDMIEAITLNTELQNIGYTLSAEDVVKLAYCDKTSVKEILNYHKENTKGYEPMYPDFPRQVMDMDEATFRFHQIVHYFSTYGIERLFGVECKNGWMPDVEKTDKTKEDTTLVDLKVLELHNEEDLIKKLNKTLSKKERFTYIERDLMKEYLDKLDFENNPITFKENIALLIPEKKDGLSIKEYLLKVCTHPGDVLDTLELYNRQLNHEPTKMTTSLKKGFVRALESFTNEKSLSENLGQNRERNIYLLNNISYGCFADKNKPLYKVVNDLKNKQIKTWRSRVESNFSKLSEIQKNNDDNILNIQNETINELLSLLRERPGEYLRMAGRLYRQLPESTHEAVKNDLLGFAEKGNFKMQTLLSNVTFFGQNYEKNKANNTRNFRFSGRMNKNTEKTGNINRKEEEWNYLYDLSRELVKAQMKTMTTSLENKKVFIDEQNYDFKNTLVNTNEKAQENGFLSSGIAFKIPENANTLRFFVFWNDREKRVDLDLHSFYINKEGIEEHVGWNSDFSKDGICHSGDITTSNNSAEYIDINLNNNNVSYASTTLNSFNVRNFTNIETAYCGVLLVDRTEKDVNLYNPKNCFLSYDLTNIEHDETSLMDIFPNERFMRVAARMNHNGMNKQKIMASSYGLTEYLNDFCETHNIERVDTVEEAEVVISLSRVENCEKDNYCLLDNNYGLDEIEISTNENPQINEEIDNQNSDDMKCGKEIEEKSVDEMEI